MSTLMLLSKTAMITVQAGNRAPRKLDVKITETGALLRGLSPRRRRLCGLAGDRLLEVRWLGS